jgi:hypothetical protein
LRELDLGACQMVTDASVPALQRIESLKVIHLPLTGVTAKAVKELKRVLPGLKVN